MAIKEEILDSAEGEKVDDDVSNTEVDCGACDEGDFVELLDIAEGELVDDNVSTADVDGVCDDIKELDLLTEVSCIELMLKLVLAEVSVASVLLDTLEADNWLEMLDRIEVCVKELLEKTD